MSDDRQDPPAAPGGANSDESSGRAAASLSRVEKLFLGGIIIFCLGFVVSSAIAAVGWDRWIWPTLLAFLLGLLLATLSYAFLGGVAGNQVVVGGIKLVGAAGLVVGVTYLLAGKLREEMESARKANESGGRAAQLVRLQASVSEKQARIADLDRDLHESRERVKQLETTAAPDIVARLRSASPDMPLGQEVLRLFRTGSGPFRREIGSLEIAVRFHQDVEPGTFFYCHSALAERIGENPVKFQYLDPQTQRITRINLRPGNDIGAGLCQGLEYQAQLGCDAAQALFPGAIGRCDRNGVNWNASESDRIYRLSAAILNPDLVPQSAIGAPR